MVPFATRHIGPNAQQIQLMLNELGCESLDAMIQKTIPAAILTPVADDAIGQAMSEQEATQYLRAMVSQNNVQRSYLGLGYYGTITPAVIQRNILENPGWYTQYTPYQAEISQGRLTSLLNFQTMIMELTGHEVANASVLDEATAVGEGVNLCAAARDIEDNQGSVFVSRDCFPQTISVLKARAWARGFKVIVGDHREFDFKDDVFCVVLQYPAANGEIFSDYKDFVAKAHAHNAMAVVAADLLALTILQPPATWGADVTVGSSQRFGVPLGFGGPHAAYFATRAEHTRRVPGRLIGVSKDAEGAPAVRLSLQTREQHIRREKATSNICTAQALLANMAAMYAVYHGPEGLRQIAERVHGLTSSLAEGLRSAGHKIANQFYFDTLHVKLNSNNAQAIEQYADTKGMALRVVASDQMAVSLDETTTKEDVADLLRCFTLGSNAKPHVVESKIKNLPRALERGNDFMKQSVFHRYRSETNLMRYIRKLESWDLSLTTSMIPLGSCTMKLNAASELMPVSWPEINQMHPFVSAKHTQGYLKMVRELEDALCAVTGFDAFSLQPNSGAQGEYAGLVVIKKYFESRGQSMRDVCLIPSSAHGTNPASAIMAGFKVVVVKCDDRGNIDMSDLNEKLKQHSAQLACIMITYPSTHGVFEESIVEICQMVHSAGGQVYMDGANMNAQVGMSLPGTYGMDVCHLNLHKTFCIPHGGGGPGVGPIGVKNHLKPFLPGHDLVSLGSSQSVGAVAAAPYGSASILPISWMYVRMMGAAGLKNATRVAILNANYIARRLDKYYPVLYRGKNGMVAHECIVDLRDIQKSTGVTVEDVAKRLMDYGFHAPTIAWPVPGTMMIEPTESEDKDELDRFCEAMISIRSEIAEIEAGRADRLNNLLKHAPHTAKAIASDKWDRPYGRERAAFPVAWLREQKFWPKSARIDSAFGDRNFVCSCAPLEAYES